MYLNFSSAETEYYDAIKSGQFWSIWFPAGAAGDLPYSTVTIDQSDPNAVLVTIQGPLTFSGPENYKFMMVNESTGIDDWKIHELWVWNSGTSQYDVLIVK
jgi:hypothetical protein